MRLLLPHHFVNLMKKEATMIEDLQGESHLFNFMRQIFLREPSEALIHSVLTMDAAFDVDDPVPEGLRIIMAAARKNKERISAWMEELEVEYARLFLGPKSPPAVPYASFYLSESHALMTDETIAVRQAYLNAGMEVQALHRMPDDHVGTELEFLYYLTEQIISLHESGTDGEASRFYEMREAFIQQHCVLWFPELSRRIIENTESPFYRGAAWLLLDCIKGA